MMNELPVAEQKKPISLAKLATIMAVAACIAFGLCTVGALDDRIGFIIPFAIVTEVGCIIGLLVIGGIATIRSMNRKD